MTTFRTVWPSLLVSAFVAGCATVDYTSWTTIVQLPRDRTSYFCSSRVTGSTYTELKTTGIYAEILLEDLGAWSSDGGTWTQDESGVLTMASTTRTALPRTYKDRTCLIWLGGDDTMEEALADLCHDIDDSKPEQEILNHDVLIPVEQFEQEIRRPYPVLVHPDMEKETGAD
jgi:hypothetical protein